jgi:polyisoprenoid-binding protein YceI
MRKILSIAFLITLVTTGYGQTEWNIDKSNSSINFTTVHMLISEVGGNFTEFKATVVSDNTEKFAGGAVEFSANASSINTDNERRDNHLRSADFFDVEKYPELSFKGKITKEGENYFLVGNFNMHGVSKPVKFDVKYNGQISTSRGKIAGFKVVGVINRFDYGLTWDKTIEAGGLVVSKEITIVCNVKMREVVK